MIPIEFDLPSRYGFTMKGWDFSTAELADAMKGKRMLNPAFELGSNLCPWNCEFCFTEDPANTEGTKRRLDNEMSLEERLLLIDQAADLGTRSINFVGAGEPTIDPDFFVLLKKMRSRNITPIVYSEGALKLTGKDFVKKLYDHEATVVLKVNTLKDETYQNAIVAGPVGRKVPRAQNYFKDRDRALDLLIETKFNYNEPTRLAFDTIICKENLAEILDIHRFARRYNIFVLFVNYLPSGRSTQVMHNAITREEQYAIFQEMAAIDRTEFGIEHRACFPYAGGVPCTIRGFGLYVKIGGSVFDCPGEAQSIGNVRTESLQQIWEKAHPIQSNFDGGCLPRKLFWERQRAQTIGAQTAPVETLT